MGLGHTLMEHYLFDGEGRIRNLGAIDYRIPTSMDLPKSMESLIVENADGPGPYGAKGMSEGALLCVAPAVAAAVRDATGAVIRDLPLSPERVWRALQERADRREARRTRSTSPFDLPPDELLALVGGKAANLAVMLGPELRLPVPPGFVVTTEACRAYLAGGWPDGLDDGAARADGRRRGGDGPAVRRSREPAAGQRPVRRAGLDARDDGHDPGPRARTTPRRRAWPRRPATRPSRRPAATGSVSMFRDIVGVDAVPEDPWAQLRLAVEAVFRSWNSDRAIAYRRREGIPDDLGTAVTVQAMVFGNLGADSGTGVAFTRNPATGEPVLYGDVLFDAQGEDVVAGTHRTEPIGVPRTSACPEVARVAGVDRRPGSSTTCATCATSSSRSSAAGCGCSRSGSASAARRRRSGWPSTWPRTRRSR